MKRDSKVSEKLVDRTIYLMGKKGSLDLTVREIATEAEVNVAAVNYYFDSKEQLFSMVKERFASAFGEVVAKLQDEQSPPEERLFHWAYEIIGYIVDYPGVLNLVSRLLNDPRHAEFSKVLHSHVNFCFQQIRGLIGQLGDNDDGELLDFKTVMLISSLAQPESVVKGCPFDGASLSDPENRKKFLRLLIAMLKK